MKYMARTSYTPFKGFENITMPLGMIIATIKVGMMFSGLGALVGGALYWVLSDVFIQHQPLRVLATHQSMYAFLLIGALAGLYVGLYLYKKSKLNIFS